MDVCECELYFRQSYERKTFVISTHPTLSCNWALRGNTAEELWLLHNFSIPTYMLFVYTSIFSLKQWQNVFTQLHFCVFDIEKVLFNSILNVHLFARTIFLHFGMLSSDDLTENKTCVVCRKLNSLMCPIKSNIVDSKRAISISVLNYTNSNILPRNLFQLLINSKYHISFQCTYPFSDKVCLKPTFWCSYISRVLITYISSVFIFWTHNSIIFCFRDENAEKTMNEWAFHSLQRLLLL